jgi:hypothetical protein
MCTRDTCHTLTSTINLPDDLLVVDRTNVENCIAQDMGSIPSQVTTQVLRVRCNVDFTLPTSQFQLNIFTKSLISTRPLPFIFVLFRWFRVLGGLLSYLPTRDLYLAGFLMTDVFMCVVMQNGMSLWSSRHMIFAFA